MALIDIPASTPTDVSGGTANGLVIANVGSSAVQIGPTDPSVDGPAFVLAANASVIMEPGSAWAASTWVAYAVMGGQISAVEVA